MCVFIHMYVCKLYITFKKNISEANGIILNHHCEGRNPLGSRYIHLWLAMLCLLTLPLMKQGQVNNRLRSPCLVSMMKLSTWAVVLGFLPGSLGPLTHTYFPNIERQRPMDP